MSRNFGGIVLPRLLATALALGLIAWGVSGLEAVSEGATVRSLAAAIDSGGQPRLEVLDRIFESRVSDRVSASCYSPNLDALATVGATEVALAIAAADPIRTDRAAEGTEIAIRKSLQCSPLDGGMWLRLATLDVLRRGPSPRTAEFIKLSYLTAPNEGWVVRSRVDLSSRLFDAGFSAVEQELRADIRTMVNFDENRHIADMFVAAPETVRAIYREWVVLLPEARRQALRASLQRRGTALGGS
jgi:hypothetical protein